MKDGITEIFEKRPGDYLYYTGSATNQSCKSRNIQKYNHPNQNETYQRRDRISRLSCRIKKRQKSLYIEGVFLQGNIKNRNGRMYPMETLRREVGRYNEANVNAGRALGELGHPDGPTVNLGSSFP